MPTREEFAGRVAAYSAARDRASRRRVRLACLAFLRPSAAFGVFLAPVVCPVAIFARRVARWEVATARGAGLVCPDCGAAFRGRWAARALGSGRCGRCGVPVRDGEG